MAGVRTQKTETDKHWDKRAQTYADKRQVNIDDLVQRQLENDFLLKHLDKNDRILEVGCGNGFLTQMLRERVAYIDGFDFAENMISTGKELYGEKNNRFFVDSVLDAKNVKSPYDKIVCVRVLINLVDATEQKRAIANMASWLKPGGTLLLVEGYLDGFEELNSLREKCGLAKIKPAAINFYSHLRDVKPEIDKHFIETASWHSGMFDLLTRIVYPLVVGADKASGPAEFHDKILPLARAFNPDVLEPLGRLHGFALKKR